MSKDLKWVIDDLRGRSGSKVVTGELRCEPNGVAEDQRVSLGA